MTDVLDLPPPPNAEVQWWADVRTALAKRSQPPRGGFHPENDWRPVRFVRARQLCCRCWHYIPKGSPGNTTGTRGTKAWWHPGWDVWMCVPCRSADVDFELQYEEWQREQQEQEGSDGRAA